MKNGTENEWKLLYTDIGFYTNYRLAFLAGVAALLC